MISDDYKTPEMKASYHLTTNAHKLTRSTCVLTTRYPDQIAKKVEKTPQAREFGVWVPPDLTCHPADEWLVIWKKYMALCPPASRMSQQEEKSHD